LDDIRNYCETDVVNTYLVFLHFQAMRGSLTPAQHAERCALVRTTIERSPEPHWKLFLSRWQ
ncbi:MAG TPA: 3'-5' exonuclease, partial [Burkholderiales bacterium]|nr:3'-5' exonuclease [Burkholderiales bacterium]